MKGVHAMTWFEPDERAARGRRTVRETGFALPETPLTVLQLSWRDFVYAEVWSRPGLDRRSRFIISIVGAATARGPQWILNGYIRGALQGGELSLLELREIALHMTAYT